MNIPEPPPKYYGNRQDPFERSYADVGIASDVQKSIFAFLLGRFPDGARFADNDGRLPLALALEASAPLESVIEPLIAAAPDALVTRDTKTRFWPFLLAAASEYSLDDALALLKSNPAVLTFRRKSEYELEVEQLMSRGIKYEKLQQEKLALEDKVEVLEEENASLKCQLEDREATICRLEEERSASAEGLASKRKQHLDEELEDDEQEGRKKARIE
jgi:predicted RNase H-like nuclease (RuvC/YqgF family)